MTPPTPARAYAVWGVALLAYVVAVFHRASLGVAAVDAQERFSAGASAVSLFLVLQLAVYAGLQVPVGVALDRLGSRRHDPRRRGHDGRRAARAGARRPTCPTAVAARVLVGAGDAMTFISVLRRGLALVRRAGRPADHPAHRHPRSARVRSLAAYPLVALLHGTSWQTTFLGAAATGVLVAVLVLVALRDAPPGTVPAPAGRPGRAARAPSPTPGGSRARASGSTRTWSPSSPAPSSRCCGATRSSSSGRGSRPATAAGLLTLLVVVGMGVGPLLGRLCGRWPLRRSVLVFSILGATVDRLDGRAAVAGAGAAGAAGRARRRPRHQRARAR